MKNNQGKNGPVMYKLIKILTKHLILYFPNTSTYSSSKEPGKKNPSPNWANKFGGGFLQEMRRMFFFGGGATFTAHSEYHVGEKKIIYTMYMLNYQTGPPSFTKPPKSLP